MNNGIYYMNSTTLFLLSEQKYFFRIWIILKNEPVFKPILLKTYTDANIREMTKFRGMILVNLKEYYLW
jgi:hypothetical protein